MYGRVAVDKEEIVFFYTDPKNGMNKKIQIVLTSVSLLSMIGCNIDVADRTLFTQISGTIEESKANGVFLAEYRSNRELIKKAWVEIHWVYDTLGNIKKQKGHELYIEAKDSIGLSDSWSECEQGDTSNGNMVDGARYLTYRLTEEELSKDTLIYYIYGGKKRKCMGELLLIKKK
ncbi:hypothetical protein G8C41_01195 [Apibacter sp. B3706]|uniref:hypothetical protein n=1 Tax=Apibacter sp. B3706 TaxID=2656760 RepID=UPI00140AFB25|nr:hypothetical protein [Apibacter sp. B3706]QII69491.1 hypothetical protein G8C41_01195 [Apibacter sp. B3706]